MMACPRCGSRLARSASGVSSGVTCGGFRVGFRVSFRGGFRHASVRSVRVASVRFGKGKGCAMKSVLRNLLLLNKYLQ